MDSPLGGWTIEHEGWLYKRGAGFQPKLPPIPNEASTDKNGITNPGRSSVTKLGQRYPSGIPSGLFNNLKGKQEKLRYFILLYRKGSPTAREEAELRYYSTKPDFSTKDAANKNKLLANVKGKVYLRESDSIMVVEDPRSSNTVSIELHTEGRIYYFRPALSPKDVESQALTIANQWVHSVQNLIDKIREWNLNYGGEIIETGDLGSIYSNETKESKHSAPLKEQRKNSKKPNDGSFIARAVSSFNNFRLMRSMSTGSQAKRVSEQSKSHYGRYESMTFSEVPVPQVNFNDFEADDKSDHGNASFKIGASFPKISGNSANFNSQSLITFKPPLKSVKKTKGTRNTNSKFSNNNSEASFGDFEENDSDSDDERDEKEPFPVYTRSDIPPNVGYESIWNAKGIDGYLNVIAHFGPVETDVNRLFHFVENRVKQLDERMQVIRELKKNVSEPVIAHQKTTFKALQKVYTDFDKRLHLLEVTKGRLEQTIDLMKTQVNELKVKLHNIVENNQKTVAQIKKVKNAIENAAKDVSMKQTLLRNATLQATLSNADTNTINSEQRTQNLSKLKQKVKRFMKNSTVQSTLSNEEEDVDELETELEYSNQTHKDMLARLHALENQHASTFVESLKELQDLEKSRLEIQKRLMEDVIESDIQLMDALEHRSHTVLEGMKSIDTERDMKTTALELLKLAEKLNKDKLGEYKVQDSKKA